MQLERMADFFAARLDSYDSHMQEDIERAREFYGYTASLLPMEPGAAVLDLGCGTGLELEPYFARNPEARVVGIDLSADMLAALRAKFPSRGSRQQQPDLELICGSYFDVPLGEDRFDAAVSVESLHHFPASQKLDLYRRLRAALKVGGRFILTDYFAESEEAERLYFRELDRLKREQGLELSALYHYDTPLTVEHELQVLRDAGFARAEILRSWGNTCTVSAWR